MATLAAFRAHFSSASKHCPFPFGTPALMLCLFAILVPLPSTATSAQSKASLKDSLNRADTGQTELHIFYVHGIGINPPKHSPGPQVFETSLQFRKSFCHLKQIDCTTLAGEPLGRFYAGTNRFDLSDPKYRSGPGLDYLAEHIWKNEADWAAAAPFVDNYILRRKRGSAIYLHEINWWPLVLSAKCRQIIAVDSALVDYDKIHTQVCSAPTSGPDAMGRYKSYQWIAPKDPRPRVRPWPKGTSFNRWLKHDIMDWSFADAVLSVGPLHQYLTEGIRETILESFSPAPNQEFIIVSHSLGSYLMFSALDLPIDSKEAQSSGWKDRLDAVLSNTSHAFFMANQLSLLELANLDADAGKQMKQHLESWITARKQAKQPQPTIVAFSDPDDLLTWQVPALIATPDGNGDSILVDNLPEINAWRLLWLFANPETAHTTYDKNKHVVRAMVPQEGPVAQGAH